MADEVVTTPSEQETEALMYQAMSDKMREDGLDASPEEVEKVVDALSPPDGSEEPPPEFTEKEKEIIAAMEEQQKEYMRQNPTYVVRGALLYCNCGSHCRRLNLPRSHGVYVLNRPLMHAGDNVGGMEGPTLNITTFGVCSKGGPGSITLQKEIARNDDGTFMEGVASTGVITGSPCLPQIVQQWQDTHADTKVGAEQLPALTTLSFLMCGRGGTIGVWRSGQEDPDK